VQSNLLIFYYSLNDGGRVYDHILCWSRCTLVCAFVVNAKANAGFFSHDTATSLPRPSRRSRTLRFNSNSHCDCSVVTGWGVETQTKVLVQRLLINMRCTINSVTRSMNCPADKYICVALLTEWREAWITCFIRSVNLWFNWPVGSTPFQPFKGCAMSIEHPIQVLSVI